MKSKEIDIEIKKKLKEIEKKRSTQDLVEFLISKDSIHNLNKTLGEGTYNKISQVFTFQKPRAVRTSTRKEEQQLEDPNLLSKISSSSLILKTLARVGSGTYFKEYDGDLKRFIKDPEKKDPNENRKQKLVDSGQFESVAYQIISAVNCLHSQDITHGDIKPENFLFYEKNGEIKVVLGDLDGLGKVNAKGELENKPKTEGTVKYWPLDIKDLNNKKHADIDATFLTLLELYVGETQQDGNLNFGWIAKDFNKKNSKSKRDEWIEDKLQSIKDPNVRQLFDDLRNHNTKKALGNPIFKNSKIENAPKSYYFLNGYPDKYASLKDQTDSTLGIYSRSVQNIIVGAEILRSKFQNPNYGKKKNLEHLKAEYKQWLQDAQKVSLKSDNFDVIADHLLLNLKKDKEAFENRTTTTDIMATAMGGILGGLGGAAAGTTYGAIIGAVIGSIIPGLGTAVGALIGIVIATFMGAILGGGILLGASKALRNKELSSDEFKPAIDIDKLKENEKSNINTVTCKSVEIKTSPSKDEPLIDDDEGDCMSMGGMPRRNNTF